jgi:hypothetical protein
VSVGLTGPFLDVAWVDISLLAREHISNSEQCVPLHAPKRERRARGRGQRVDTRTLMSSMAVVLSSAQWRLRRPSVSGGWWRSDEGETMSNLAFNSIASLLWLTDSPHKVEWGVVAGHGGSGERLVPASGAGVDLLRSRG